MTDNQYSIIFMGTPDFAVPTLKKILTESRHKVIGVVTQPDRPSGRGLKMISPPVKNITLDNDITLIQPEKVRRKAVKEWLRNLEPDLLVVIAYGKILPKSILTIPKVGCINVHASLLPLYRGAAPINWAIINGEKETGITTMLMDESMDTGDILLQERITISENENAESVHNRLAGLGADVLVRTLDLMSQGNIEARTQDHAKATYAPMLDKKTGAINWSKNARDIHNLVRGLDPWPGAFTFYKGKRIKVYETVMGDEHHNTSMKNGQFIHTDKLNGLEVSTGHGCLWLRTIQPESKGKIHGSDFFNGYRCTFDDCFTTPQD